MRLQLNLRGNRRFQLVYIRHHAGCSLFCFSRMRGPESYLTPRILRDFEKQGERQSQYSCVCVRLSNKNPLLKVGAHIRVKYRLYRWFDTRSA